MDREQKRLKLFADVLMPGVEFAAMQRILFAMRVVRFEALQQQESIRRHTAKYPGRIGNVRIWWRIRRPDGSLYFVNLDRGEYREKPPEDESLILDIPQLPPDEECRDVIQACIERGKMFLPGPGYGHDLMSLAGRLLQDSGQLEREAHAMIEETIPIASDASAEQVARALGRLYAECLFLPRTDNVAFSASILLLQLQRMMGMWMEQKWWLEPVDHYYGYVSHLAGEANLRPELSEALTEIVQGEYENGRNGLNRALNAPSLVRMSEELTRAYHAFTVTLMVEKAAEENGLDVHVPTSQTVLEESWVCTQTGLAQGAWMMISHPNEIPNLLRRDSTRKSLTLEQTARAWGSNHVFPAVNRKFAAILAAHAMTLSDDLAEVKAGLDLLLRFRGELTRMDHNFESGWIDQATLGAYKKLGRKDEAGRLAANIAGKLVVASVLARSTTRA